MTVFFLVNRLKSMASDYFKMHKNMPTLRGTGVFKEEKAPHLMSYLQDVSAGKEKKKSKNKSPQGIQARKGRQDKGLRGCTGNLGTTPTSRFTLLPRKRTWEIRYCRTRGTKGVPHGGQGPT